jgi:ATP-dependent phosphoenolpyruvate carboxykinase
MTIASGQGIETSTGALAVNTGEYTDSLDRFIVKDSISENQVWWGKVTLLSLLLLKHYTKKVTLICLTKKYSLGTLMYVLTLITD